MSAATPPRSYNARAEWLWLSGSLVVLVLSAILSTTPDVVSLFGTEIPPLCPYRWATGMKCLGCGLTRSFVFMGHLEVGSAFDAHRLGPALFLAVAIQVPLRVYRLWRYRH